MKNKQIANHNLDEDFRLLQQEVFFKSPLQLEAILNNIPDIAWLKDKESRFICVNEAFGKACGMDPRELVGKNDLDIWPKDLAERYRADDREVMESGERKCVDEPLADKEGKIQWIETIKTPVYNDKDEVIGTTGIARDITERKVFEDKLRQAQAELEIRVKVRTAELAKTNEELRKEISEHKIATDALQASELKYRLIFENVPVSIWEEDFSEVVSFLDNLNKKGITDLRLYFKENPKELMKAISLVKVLDVNEAALGIYSATAKEQLFGSLDKVFTDESYAVFIEELIAISQGATYFESECINRALDGQSKTMILRMSIPSDKTKLNRLIVTLADITERNRIQHDLKAREHFLSSIFSSIQDGISVLDKEMNIIQVNPVMEKWYAHNMPLVGKKCYQAYHCANKVCSVCPTQRALKTEKAAYDVVPKTGPGGQIIGWLDLYTFPLFDEKTGNMYGCIEYVRDISEKKEAERLKEELNKELTVSNERFKKLALTDSHTGLFNHRYLTDVIESEFHRAKRYAYPLSVLMLDIDYFKSINDVYGHPFGDLVLKQFATQLRKLVRRYDIVIRFGGEEFIIISPSIDRQQALFMAQRLLDSLNIFNFGDKKHSVKLKLSVAVVTTPEDRVAKGADLVTIADVILGKAKESGGNRVFTSSDVVIKKKDDKTDIKLLKVKIEKLTKRANQSLIEAILAFAKTIELKDHYTGEHVENTVHYATEIAKAMKLSREEIEVVKEASMLHDLGKIGISENILHKKSKLTRKEFDEIKKHPQIGADILRPIQFLHPIIPLILYHHERWDGSGYPSGIKAEEIPVGARIIALADVYQALTSDRPYRKAYTKSKAMKIIEDGSGTQFDPQIVSVFMKILAR
jgi:diguanylate cyclase (GGDEF)-like protein/PAS domain S-box-containing protein